MQTKRTRVMAGPSRETGGGRASSAGQLGMKRRRQVAALLHQHRVAVVARQDAHAAPDPPDDRRADEDRLQSARPRRAELRHAAVQLPAVGVALDVDIHQAEALLVGVRDPAGQQDGAGAGAEDGPARAELAQRLEQVLGVAAA